MLQETVEQVSRKQYALPCVLELHASSIYDLPATPEGNTMPVDSRDDNELSVLQRHVSLQSSTLDGWMVNPHILQVMSPKTIDDNSTDSAYRLVPTTSIIRSISPSPYNDEELLPNSRVDTSGGLGTSKANVLASGYNEQSKTTTSASGEEVVTV